MPATAASSPVQRLPSDIFYIIFSLVAKDDRPRMCSCEDHGPRAHDVCYNCPNHRRCRHKFHDPFPVPHSCVYNVGWVQLGHVCRLWRSVLMQARILWANDLCTLNNSALEAFLYRAGQQSLNIDFRTVYAEYMRCKELRDWRSKLLSRNIRKARAVRGNWTRDELYTLESVPPPSLEILELSSSIAITLRISNLREAVLDGPITLHAPVLLRAKCIGPSSMLLHSPLLRRLELSWPISRCGEILPFLAAVPCLEELVMEWLDNSPPHEVDTQHTVHSQDLRSPDPSSSLPALSEIRVSGYGVTHQSIGKLLIHLITASASNLKTFEAVSTHHALMQSSVAIDALRTAAHAIKADSVYLHFTHAIFNGIAALVSLSRQDSRYNPDLCPTVTFKLIVPSFAIDDAIRTKFMSLLPLDCITHLFVDCLPMHRDGPRLYAQPEFCAALTELTSVHTLNARDNNRYSNNDGFFPAEHPLVGSIVNTRLSALKALHVSYPRDLFRDWWRRLATALAIRKRIGRPFTSLCISYNWGSNVRRPEGAALSPLETFHEQTEVSHYEPDTFIANAPVRAFNLDGTNVWAKEKVESVARSLFAQVVETIEVEEASPLRPVWPPIL